MSREATRAGNAMDRWCGKETPSTPSGRRLRSAEAAPPVAAPKHTRHASLLSWEGGGHPERKPFHAATHNTHIYGVHTRARAHTHTLTPSGTRAEKSSHYNDGWRRLCCPLPLCSMAGERPGRGSRGCVSACFCGLLGLLPSRPCRLICLTPLRSPFSVPRTKSSVPPSL